MNIPKCPACGSTTVQYHYSMSTCMGWAHIIKDGVDISEDPNYHTSYYTCCNCRRRFHISSHCGEDEIVDDGPDTTTYIPEAITPTSITTEGVLPDYYLAVTDKTLKNEIEVPLQVDLNQIMDEIKKLGAAIEELKKELK